MRSWFTAAVFLALISTGARAEIVSASSNGFNLRHVAEVPNVTATVVWAALTGKFFVERLKGTSREARHVAEMLVTSAAIPPLSVFWRLVGSVRFRVPFA